MTDVELLAWARERYRNPYMGLERPRKMRHENVKQRAMFGTCGRRDPSGP